MKYNRLGNTGLLVSDLCLGTMIFGDDGRGTSANEATRLIQHFLDAGGNHIDTADAYTGGRSEEIIGQAIRDRRDQVVLATKVRVPTGQASTKRDCRATIFYGPSKPACAAWTPTTSTSTTCTRGTC